MLETVWPTLNPRRALVLIVEEDGQTIGCVALFPAWHLDGAWIDPAHRQRVSMLRRLLKAAGDLFRVLDVREVLAMATSEHGRRLVKRLGPFVHLDCDHFSVNVEGR